MGVYISGLKMPQDGRITLQIDSTGGVYVVNKFSITSEKYEKSMIATGIQPHGRLIDADFEEMHYTSMTTNPTPDVTEQDKHNSLVIVRALQMAKTIIEAEE